MVTISVSRPLTLYIIPHFWEFVNRQNKQSFYEFLFIFCAFAEKPVRASVDRWLQNKEKSG